MRFGVRTRIFLAIFGITLLVGLGAGALLEIRMRADLELAVQDELKRDTEILEAHLGALGVVESDADLDRAVDRIAAPTGARLTVIDEAGRVIGESTRSGAELARMDNHASRPEVARASTERWALARRRSSTVNTDLLYAARRTSLPDGRVVTIRAGKLLSEIEAAVWSLRLNLLLAAGLALAAALISAGFASRWMQNTLERLVSQARLLSGSSGDEDDDGGVRPSVDALSRRLERTVRALAAERDQVRSLERVRTDFVANVSHELRTPVAIIASTSETLVGGAIDDPEVARPFTEAVHRQAVRMARIIDELLMLSRIEAGRLPIAPERLEIRPVLQQIIQLQSAAHPEREAVILDVAGDLVARIDRAAFEHAIGNLVENAVKYVPTEASIEVRARPEGERLIVEVIDQGPGIAEAHAHRVFERFYRVDAGRSREVGGTGLGLSLVRHLAEAMGGRVALTANAPSGCVFRVEVPLDAG